VTTVYCAMSGGVDSSVAAALLLEGGHDVIGVTLELHDDTDAVCCTAQAAHDAARICRTLGIEHVTLDASGVFVREVVEPFADEYAEGRTPNPCVLCNERVKFGELLAWVQARGGDKLATGHYARVVDRGEERWLARGLDAAKDQSYFLYRLTPERLERLLFPVGEMHKPDVRAYADRLGLPAARRPESQEVCFAPAGEHAEVVAAMRPDAFTPGEIVDESGAVLGTHGGLGRYTVGQRKGLGIAHTEPLYVLAIDAPANRVVVGSHDSLRVSRVVASDPIWRLPGDAPVTAAVRYRMSPRTATASPQGDSLDVAFNEPLEGVAPGQAVVCYQADLVVGGGTIAWAA
jgi:tRNA-specific 2-thiouridylase